MFEEYLMNERTQKKIKELIEETDPGYVWFHRFIYLRNHYRKMMERAYRRSYAYKTSLGRRILYLERAARDERALSSLGFLLYSLSSAKKELRSLLRISSKDLSSLLHTIRTKLYLSTVQTKDSHPPVRGVNTLYFTTTTKDLNTLVTTKDLKALTTIEETIVVSSIKEVSSRAYTRDAKIMPERIQRAKEYPFDSLVEFNKRGFALCPFHNDHDPSFHWHKKSNTVRCFGCGWKGSPINYVMDKNGFSFMQAVQHLQ